MQSLNGDGTPAVTPDHRKPCRSDAVDLHYDDNTRLVCSVTFEHPDNKKGLHYPHRLSEKTSEWFEPTKIWCWHCVHPFDGTPARIPTKTIATVDDNITFEVYGNFCSFACAKAYLMDKPNFDMSRQLLLMSKLMVDVYNLPPHVTPAPPRLCLTQFGGDMSIEEFRAIERTEIKLARVPFCSTPMYIHNYVPTASYDDADSPTTLDGDAADRPSRCTADSMEAKNDDANDICESGHLSSEEDDQYSGDFDDGPQGGERRSRQSHAGRWSVTGLRRVTTAVGARAGSATQSKGGGGMQRFMQ